MKLERFADAKEYLGRFSLEYHSNSAKQIDKFDLLELCGSISRIIDTEEKDDLDKSALCRLIEISNIYFKEFMNRAVRESLETLIIN